MKNSRRHNSDLLVRISLMDFPVIVFGNLYSHMVDPIEISERRYNSSRKARLQPATRFTTYILCHFPLCNVFSRNGQRYLGTIREALLIYWRRNDFIVRNGWPLLILRLTRITSLTTIFLSFLFYYTSHENFNNVSCYSTITL
jgi:hypothetical protein